MDTFSVIPFGNKPDAKTTSRMLKLWAVTTSLFILCIFLLWVSVLYGRTNRSEAAFLTGFIVVGPVGSFVLIGLRKLLQVKPTRIAWLQCIHAIIAIIGAYMVVSQDRGSTLLLLGVVLIFGSSVFSRRVAKKLGVIAIVLLVASMVWLIANASNNYVFWSAVNHLFLAVCLLVAIDFLTKKFTDLRVRLQVDNAELQLALKEINTLAMSDDLTHLPNRRSMREVLAGAQESLRMNTSQQLSLALLDLDFFKNINDRYGHTVGDEVLRLFAEKIQPELRTTDVLARWGGEEFLLMMPNTETQTAVLVLERVRKCTAEIDIPECDEALTITFSAGLASCKKNDSIWETITQADKAMYQAKAEGRNTTRIFNLDLDDVRGLKSSLLHELESGVRANELVLYYQPQVHFLGNVIGAEALVRWQHPQRGLISPGEFINVAERTSLIEEIGEWVLLTACKQLRQWNESDATRHLSLAVNVSARQLRHPAFVEKVCSIVTHTDADPHKLKLELTESMLIVDMDETILKMKKLKDFGVSFSLDDFGTGYSSLSYLKRLPLDQLKIDRSFVKDMLNDANDAVITSTIVTLAKSLGLDVIAEGVESKSQRDLLETQGCHHFQGYLFSRPLGISAFDEFVNKLNVLEGGGCGQNLGLLWR